VRESKESFDGARSGQEDERRGIRGAVLPYGAWLGKGQEL
jgi:hypothetical protein